MMDELAPSQQNNNILAQLRAIMAWGEELASAERLVLNEDDYVFEGFAFKPSTTEYVLPPDEDQEYLDKVELNPWLDYQGSIM